MRRLRALVKNLPRTSAVVRSLQGDRADWGTTEELLAGVIEMTDVTNRLLYAFNTKKGTPQPKPIVIHRPGQPEPEKPTYRDFRRALAPGREVN